MRFKGETEKTRLFFVFKKIKILVKIFGNLKKNKNPPTISESSKSQKNKNPLRDPSFSDLKGGGLFLIARYRTVYDAQFFGAL